MDMDRTMVLANRNTTSCGFSDQVRTSIARSTGNLKKRNKIRSILCGIALFFPAVSAPHSAVELAVVHAQWVACGRDSGLKVEADIKITNRETSPLATVEPVLIQERIWSRNNHGKLELKRTTATPDDFANPPQAGETSSPKHPDYLLLKGESRTWRVAEIAYVTTTDFQTTREGRELWISSRVAVGVPGSLFDVWSDPVRFVSPKACDLGAEVEVRR